MWLNVETCSRWARSARFRVPSTLIRMMSSLASSSKASDAALCHTWSTAPILSVTALSVTWERSPGTAVHRRSIWRRAIGRP